MNGERKTQKWIAASSMGVLALVVALAPLSDTVLRRGRMPVLLFLLILPVAAALTAVLSDRIATGTMCVLAAAAGVRFLPASFLPAALFWCAGSGLTACLPMRTKLMRPAMRVGMCLGTWCIALLILIRLTGGQVVNGLAQAACDWVGRSDAGTEILLRAMSAGYVRIRGAELLLPALRASGSLVIPEGMRTEMLFSLRVSLEEILPSLLCNTVIFHTAVTVLLCTVLPDWQRRKHGEKGEFSPMDQWYMPRRLGMAVFALCIGWVMAMMAGDGVGAYLGWMCMGVFRTAFILQGICWMQWMGKRMGIRSAARNVWSVILSILVPLIPMVMGMIDQRRDARHLRPKEEADQE